GGCGAGCWVPGASRGGLLLAQPSAVLARRTISPQRLDHRVELAPGRLELLEHLGARGRHLASVLLGAPARLDRVLLGLAADLRGATLGGLVSPARDREVLALDAVPVKCHRASPPFLSRQAQRTGPVPSGRVVRVSSNARVAGGDRLVELTLEVADLGTALGRILHTEGLV